jgi:hypothetical protein
LATTRKRSYGTPTLTSYGSIAKLTQGTSGDGGGGGGGGIGIMIIVMIVV